MKKEGLCAEKCDGQAQVDDEVVKDELLLVAPLKETRLSRR